MGCFIALFAMIGPRVALLFVWLATSLVDRAFDTTIVPVLGFLVAPWTTLTYSLVYAPNGGVSTLGWVFVVFAVLADVSSLTGGGATARDRYPR